MLLVAVVPFTWRVNKYCSLFLLGAGVEKKKREESLEEATTLTGEEVDTPTDGRGEGKEPRGTRAPETVKNNKI